MLLWTFLIFLNAVQAVSDTCNPLCTCSSIAIWCVNLPLHTPAQWGNWNGQHVDISFSQIRVLTESALDSLQLESLSLVADSLHHIERDALVPMSGSLTSLELAYNHFTQIPFDALRQLKVLSWLSLQSNYITALEEDEYNWGHLEQCLTSLSLANNYITHIKENTFIRLTQITQIDLTGNRIQYLHPEGFPINLAILRLSDNLIKTIPCNVLNKLRIVHVHSNLIVSTNCTYKYKHRIDKLDLANNRLSNVVSYINDTNVLCARNLDMKSNMLKAGFNVDPKCKIEKLSLSYNHIDVLDDLMFLSFKEYLVSLDLDHNSLFTLPSSMSELSALQHLSLAYNLFTSSPQLNSNLKSLSLAGNFLTSIPANQLNRVSSIHELDLSYNLISYLESSDFVGWTSMLYSLNLKGNRISHIGFDTFQQTIPIKILILSCNNIHFIHNEAMQKLNATLQVIELSSNLFSETFPLRGSTLNKIEGISFQNNEISVMSAAYFKNFTNLKYVNIEFNQLTEFNIVTNLTQNIHDLKLSYNLISYIDRNTFKHFNKIKTLDLSQNHLSRIENLTFSNLKDLSYIKLTDNIIIHIENEAFSNLSSLQLLELQRNNLSDFSLDWFSSMHNTENELTVNVSCNSINKLSGNEEIYLDILDLSMNRVNFISRDYFNPVGFRLKDLILSHNLIRELDSGTLNGLKNLRRLLLSYNEISHLKRKTFNDLIHLHLLDLSHNELTQLPHEIFHNTNALRVVDLSYNQITYLSRDIFKNTRIEHLNLKSNFINIFPMSALAQIGFTLRYLDISCNKIDNLDSSMFLNTPFLYDLILRDNFITFLPDDTFSSLDNLRKLDLSGNDIKTNFKELLHYVSNLRYLHLEKMALRSIPALHLPNLILLNLSCNSIENMVVSGSLTNLRELYLNQNNVTEFGSKFWTNFKCLITLDLSYNPIVRITSTSFMNLPFLFTLKLVSLNSLESFSLDTFLPLKSLRTLHIESFDQINKLIGLDGLSELHLHIVSTKLEKQLVGLSIPNVKRLFITGKWLNTISSKAFEGLEFRHELRLTITGTSITSLPDDMFSTLSDIPHLSLDVSYNKLTALDPATFYPNISMWHRYGTKLLTGGLRSINNPIRCECDTWWLASWLRRWLHESPEGTLDGALSLTCIDIHNRNIPLLLHHRDDCRLTALASCGFCMEINFFIMLTLFCYVVVFG